MTEQSLFRNRDKVLRPRRCDLRHSHQLSKVGRDIAGRYPDAQERVNQALSMAHVYPGGRTTLLKASSDLQEGKTRAVHAPTSTNQVSSVAWTPNHS